METERPSWDETWLKIAKDFVSRGTCLRRNFGAVVVTKDNVLVASGYTGSPRKTPDCKGDLNKCYRQEMNIPSGKNYELCRSVHAEQNAIINAAREGIKIVGCDMYTYGKDAEGNVPEINEPCNMCWRVIINAGIENVITQSKHGIQKYSVKERVKKLSENPLWEFERGYGTGKSSQ